MTAFTKRSRAAIAVFFSLLLMFTMIPTNVSAQNASAKEEVVYINLQSDGTVDSINVVNIFETDKNGHIVDYGDYESVRNMTSTDAVTFENGTVTIDTDDEKLYYEGVLKNAQIPWTIDIAYQLDGKEYTADEIAGKSGDLTITVDITDNTQCGGKFFEGFALQASLTLDTEICRSIVADGATVANVGSKKQLTYTVLPNSGAHIEVTAQVENFEMEAMAINGIPLSLDINVDTEALLGEVTTLLDAIAQLDDGAKTLESGAGQLQSGAKDALQSGTAELQNGAAELESGIVELNSGIKKIEEALSTLHQKSPELTNGSAEMNKALATLQEALSKVSFTADDLTALTDASSAFMDGINEITSGVTALEENVSYAAYKALLAEKGLDLDFLKRSNTDAAAGLQDAINTFKQYAQLFKMMGIDANKIFSQLSDVIRLLEANNALIGGTETYLDTVNDNINTLLDGVTTLQSNYTIFNDKIGELADLLSGLAFNMTELTGAINTMATEYAKLDDGINAYTDGVAQILEGYSAVSDGSAKLLVGSKALTAGTNTLHSGAKDLAAGIMALYQGAGKLQDGTSEMRAETADIDETISEKVDALLQSVTGGSSEVTSFVSEKNTDVTMVQFVIKTPAVDKAVETAPDDADNAPKTFWQKLLALFGL